MRVLVRVDVSQFQSTALQPGDLGEGFSFYVLGNIAPCHITDVDMEEKRAQRRTEILCGGQAGKQFDWRDWTSIDEYDVAADAQGRVGNGELNGFIGGGCARHKGGAGQHSVAMQFDDCLVDAAGEAEVVGIDDEAFHQLSLPTWTRRHPAVLPRIFRYAYSLV